ncbi:MAG TPA: hypothetical protein VFE98_08680 [Candidatus Bathyarchaeia archaeon]|nr:hypothetical protein [Candidatus Bathyarchaeia archaeon]
MRRKLLEISSNYEVQGLLNDIRHLRSDAFVEVSVSIFLVLISAFFAVAGILVGGRVSLMLALIFLSLSLGTVAMVFGWYDVYSRTENVMHFVDTAPKPPAASPKVS